VGHQKSITPLTTREKKRKGKHPWERPSFLLEREVGEKARSLGSSLRGRGGGEGGGEGEGGLVRLVS